MKNKIFTVLIVMLLFLCFIIEFYNGYSKRKEYKEIKESNGINYLVLVNKDNKIPDKWEEKAVLSIWKDVNLESVLIEKETLENYYKLREVLLSEGVHIELDSCFRTYQEQKEFRDIFVKEYGEEYLKKYVAEAGYSEHHTGLAIDICIIKDERIVDDIDTLIKEKEIFNKIYERMTDFGFILRYPEGKEEITGFSFEPWHLRYVGSSKIAKDITKRGLTLEEYLGE